MQKYNVSRETFDKLKTYEALLNEWQNKFNLVSNRSLKEAWVRHFLDSAQLLKYIPDNAKKLYDFGSGAGFPGMVLAILAAEKIPNLEVKLIESINKKTVYLNAVREACRLNVDIINDRVENIKLPKADIITSRAMCNLNQLLLYADIFVGKKTVMIFPKGKSYKEELIEAQRNWSFDFKIEKNEVCEDGVILIIKNLTSKRGVK